MLWLTNLKNNALLFLGAALGVLFLLFGIQREKNKRLESEIKHKDNEIERKQQAVENVIQQVDTQQAINAAHKKAKERENAKAHKSYSGTRTRPNSGNFSGGVPDDTDY